MKKILLLLFSFLSLEVSASQLKTIEWELNKEDNGIRVYKPKNYTHSSGIVPIRFKATLKHNISKVLTVLSDNTRKKEWMPSVKLIKELEKITEKHRIVYYRYEAPWPFNDRDFVVRSKGEFYPEKVSVSVELISTEHQLDPKPNQAVRAITYDGYSIITAKSEFETEVEMAFLNDFKGNIPTFVINIVQAQWPYGFMKNLREQLAKKDITINPEFTSDLVPWKSKTSSL